MLAASWQEEKEMVTEKQRQPVEMNVLCPLEGQIWADWRCVCL